MNQWILSFCRDIRYLSKIVYKNLNCSIKFNKPTVYNKNGKKSPIILIHGSSGNQSEWIEAEKYLEKYFSEHPTYAFTLDSGIIIENNSCYQGNNNASMNNWSIEEYCNELDKCVKYIQELHDKKQIILIGHSMGGVIATKYESLNVNKISRVITISSPLQGAPLLKNNIIKNIFNTVRHKQMTPESEFLTQLNEEVKSRYDKYITIGSINDLHVPNEYSKLIGNDKHLTINSYGHFSIVACEHVWEYLLSFFPLD